MVPGQLLKKNLASAHEVISEQCVRPSQRNAPKIDPPDGLALGSGVEACKARRLLADWYTEKPYAPRAITSKPEISLGTKDRFGARFGRVLRG